jgi:hypothetical protein
MVRTKNDRQRYAAGEKGRNRRAGRGRTRAAHAKNEKGTPLLHRNPLRSFKPPKEKKEKNPTPPRRLSTKPGGAIGASGRLRCYLPRKTAPSACHAT